MGEIEATVVAAAVCGSDRFRFRQGQHLLTLGHEAIVQDSNGLNYVLRPFVGCGNCHACTHGLQVLCEDGYAFGHGDGPGAFSGRLSVPEEMLYPVASADASLAIADALACAINAAKLALAAPNTQVAIVGRGSLARLTREVCAYYGARIVEAEAAGECDAIIECSADASGRKLQQLILDARPGTRMVAMSVFNQTAWLATRQWAAKGLTLVGLHGYIVSPERDDLAEAIDLIEDSVLDLNSLVKFQPWPSESQLAEAMRNGTAKKRVFVRKGEA